eukprot:g4895.t1
MIWETLPVDIVVCIVRYTESSQVPSLRLVNKHWRLCCDSTVSEVSISETAVKLFGTPSRALEQVTQRFPKLKSLVLWHLNPQSTWMLSRLKELKLLDLGGTQISDENLRSIAPLTKLETLRLWDTRTGDKGLECISNLTRLRSLSLQDTCASDQGMHFVARFKHLTSLNLDRTEIGDVGVRILLESNRPLVNLKNLSLWRTKVGDQSMEQILLLTNLEKLNIGFTRVTKEGLESISTLTKLTSVETWGIKAKCASSPNRQKQRR